MGANAQTSVPTFTAGEVLTAANMNISARTGVPVFSNTTTRDAGFGGTGEKTLAEGQLCYLEDSNVVQYYDGAAWATVGPTTVTSAVVQVKGATSTTTTTSTSTTYATTNNAVSITPTSASNKVLIQYQIPFDMTRTSTNTGYGLHRLKRGSTVIWQFDFVANSLRYGVGGFAASSSTFTGGQFIGLVLDSPATTSSTTYTVEFACQDGTLVVNGNPGTTSGGSIIAMEVTP